MNGIKKFGMISILSVAALATTAFADVSSGTNKTFTTPRESTTMSEYKPSLGINAGIASPESSRKSGAAYGIEYGFQPIIPFSSAVELSGFVSEHQNNSPTLTRTKLMYKAAYNFAGDIPFIKYSYAGLQVGPVFDNVNNKLDTELGVAPQLGFDIPVGNLDSHYTLGANANYMFVGGPHNDAFALNGVAKYWF
jgi:hypothetical protein